MWRACVKNQPHHRNPFTSTLIPGRVYLCDSALIHVLMCCTSQSDAACIFLTNACGWRMFMRRVMGVQGFCWSSVENHRDLPDDGKEPHTSELRSSEHQGSQPPLHPLGSKDCTAHALGIHFQAREVPGDYQDQSAQLHYEHITPGQMGYLLSGDKGSAMDIVYLVSEITFEVVSHRTLILKLGKHRLGEGTGRWTGSWLNCWTEG